MSGLMLATVISMGVALTLIRYVKRHLSSASFFHVKTPTHRSNRIYYTVHIPIIGLPKSGKTTIFARLCHQFRDYEDEGVKTHLLERSQEEILRQRELDQRSASETTSIVGRRSTNEMIDAEYAAFLQHKTVSSSQAETGYTSVTYQSYDTHAESDAKVLIAWEDIPGAFLAREQFHESNIFPRLAVASGLILVIDGYQSYMMSQQERLSEYFLPYHQVLDYCKAHGHSDILLWFMITKVDRLPDSAQDTGFWHNFIGQHVMLTLNLKSDQAQPCSQPLISVVGVHSHQTPQGHQPLQLIKKIIHRRVKDQNSYRQHVRRKSHVLWLALLSFGISLWCAQGALSLMRLPPIKGERAWSTSSLEDTRSIYLERYRESMTRLSPLKFYRRFFKQKLLRIHRAHSELLHLKIDEYVDQLLDQVKRIRSHDLLELPAFINEPTHNHLWSRKRITELQQLSHSTLRFERVLVQSNLISIKATSLLHSPSMLLEDLNHLIKLETVTAHLTDDRVSMSTIEDDLNHWHHRCQQKSLRGCRVIKLIETLHLISLDMIVDQLRFVSSHRGPLDSSSTSTQLKWVKMITQWCLRAHQLGLVVDYENINRLSSHAWHFSWSQLENRLTHEQALTLYNLNRLKILKEYTDDISILLKTLEQPDTPELLFLSVKEPLSLKRRRVERISAESLALSRVLSIIPRSMHREIDQYLDWCLAQLDRPRASQLRYLRISHRWKRMIISALKLSSLQGLRDAAIHIELDLKRLPQNFELNGEMNRWKQRIQSLKAWLDPHPLKITIFDITCTHQALVGAQEYHEWSSLKRYTDLKRFYVLVQHQSAHPSTSSDARPSAQQPWTVIRAESSKTLMWAPGWHTLVSVYELDGEIDRTTPGEEYDDTLIGHPLTLVFGLPSSHPTHISLNQERSCQADIKIEDQWPSWLDYIGTID